MRVLLTGFGPFPGASANPTSALVKALAGRRRPALAGVARDTHVFATTYAAVDRELPGLLARDPDIVLMFGLASRTRHLRIETRARNAVSVLFPDARGHRPQRQTIAAGGPAALKGTAPFAFLLGALRECAVPGRLSRDAGNYVCNYAYWRALERVDTGRPLVAFVHVPSVGSKPLPMRLGDRRSISLPELAAAAEKLMLALVAAKRG